MDDSSQMAVKCELLLLKSQIKAAHFISYLEPIEPEHFQTP